MKAELIDCRLLLLSNRFLTESCAQVLALLALIGYPSAS